jgi:thiamine pyrophosphokinase
MTRRALIVGASPAVAGAGFYSRLLGEAGLVVAADAAGEWCVGLGRVPDVVEGDFDSSRSGAVARLRAAGAAVYEHPADKDVSDLDLCVARARACGAGEVAFTAVTGGRADHWLAALGTIGRAADLEAVVFEPGLTGYAVSGLGRRRVELDLIAGAVFSVLALAPSRGVSIHGAAFSLDDAVLEPLSSLGVSNRALGGPVEIVLDEGVLLVLVPSVTE